MSRIGAPLTNPALMQVKLATRDGLPPIELKPQVDGIIAHCLGRISMLVDNFVTGTIEIF